MNITIILNGVSRKKKKFYKEIYPALAKHFVLDVLETRYGGHAEELALNAAIQKVSIIVAAGGDGTLHQVINGAMRAGDRNLPVVGLIPLGSGNDFARSCSLRPEGEQLIQLLNAGQPKLTDIGKITGLDKHGKPITRFFINACSMGMGPEVVKRLEKSSRAWGPALRYFTSIVSTFFSHKPQEIYCKSSSWEWRGKARALVIANGKSFGNSIYIAPDALLDDGAFNTFIASDVPLWKFLFFLQTLKGGKKLRQDKIIYNTSPSLELIATKDCPIEAEGEWIGWLPAKIEILPGYVKFLR